MAVRDPAGAQTVVAVTLNPALDLVYEVPGLRLGRHQRGRCRLRRAAGKGVNVARALATLGCRCVAAGLVGCGELREYEAELGPRGIECRLVTVGGRTRTNITLIDPDGGGETHIRDAGFQVAPADLAPLAAALRELAGAGRVVIFSGSLPPGMRPEDLAALVDLCAGCGSAVAVDTGGAGLRALKPDAAWFVKPNRTELEEFAGRRAPDEAAMLELGAALQSRAAEVVISCGPAGAFLLAAGGAWRGQPAAPPGVVSTVGCGDALVAGFVAARIGGADPPAALRRGLAVATAAAATAGPGEFDPALADRLLGRTQVAPVPRAG